MTSLLRYVLAIIFAVFFVSASAADFSGKVVAVLDGDTIDVLVDKTPIRVRLAGIDAPEKSQPFGSRSKIALSNLVYAKQVLVQDQGPDRYGRRIGFVWVDVHVTAEWMPEGTKIPAYWNGSHWNDWITPQFTAEGIAMVAAVMPDVVFYDKASGRVSVVDDPGEGDVGVFEVKPVDTFVDGKQIPTYEIENWCWELSE
ncbi:thermonuclease family protein [Cupriavidus basilensis]|uniref:Thermonuclease family protein n=1 Tax=Cupriavidus basilensis TaxID=68895 RepID=A0A643FSK9_9BURK|nr:thermonuclease family protein [Cupriavidus basilensis]QOT82231.1 thermonuclease family protein [Cupriavidus basilensis]